MWTSARCTLSGSVGSWKAVFKLTYRDSTCSLNSSEQRHTDYLTSFISPDCLQGFLDSNRYRSITINDDGRLNSNWGLASAQNFEHSHPVALAVHCTEPIRPAEWNWPCIIIYFQWYQREDVQMFQRPAYRYGETFKIIKENPESLSIWWQQRIVDVERTPLQFHCRENAVERLAWRKVFRGFTPGCASECWRNTPCIKAGLDQLF